MAAGIRHDSDEAEEKFREIVDAKPTDDSKKGDSIVMCSKGPCYVEVKKCAAEAGKSGTINQIRAIKFIPLVVHNPITKEWFVVSPTEVVRLVLSKSRGQHTEIPFESANLSLSNVKGFGCSGADLKRRVKIVCEEALCDSPVRKIMRNIKDELVSLKSRYVVELKRYYATCGKEGCG